jgi:hypothetical protein
MRKPDTKSALLAVAMAISLLGNGTVLADGGRKHEHHQDEGHQIYDKRHHERNFYSFYHKRGHDDKDHPGRHVNHYDEYDDNDGDARLLIGLVLGGLLGYALNNAEYR